MDTKYQCFDVRYEINSSLLQLKQLYFYGSDFSTPEIPLLPRA